MSFSAKVSVWRKKRLTHMPQQSEDVSKALEAARSWLAGPPYQINIPIERMSRNKASSLLCFGVAVSITEMLFWISGRRPGMLDPCEHAVPKLHTPWPKLHALSGIPPSILKWGNWLHTVSLRLVSQSLAPGLCQAYHHRVTLSEADSKRQHDTSDESWD